MYINYLGFRNVYLDEMYVNIMYYIYKISKINFCVKFFYLYYDYYVWYIVLFEYFCLLMYWFIGYMIIISDSYWFIFI